MPAQLKPIDPNIVMQLAKRQLTLRQIASIVGCDEKTLRNRFSAEIHAAKAEGEGALVSKAVELALKGNEPMLKFVLKNKVGWSDKTIVEQTSTNTNINYNASEMTDEQLDEAIVRAQAEIESVEKELAVKPNGKANGKSNGHSHAD